MLARPVLVFVAVAALAAGFVWARSARRMLRVTRRIELSAGYDSDAARLARTAFGKDLHAAVIYVLLVFTAVAGAVSERPWSDVLRVLLIVPAVLSLRYARSIVRHARLLDARTNLEQRALEVLDQESLAPKRWSERLAPEEVPSMPGFEFGSLYQAGTGMMAGDFYDVFRITPNRVAAVIGDVTGHGIEPSISAFQAKYLLRVFLRQYRDPAQALEELNAQISGLGRLEEFISMAVVVFDTEAATLRYASAGHPAAFLWRGGEVQSLSATGPLVSLDPGAGYSSREVPLDVGDLVLLYTDGLSEARAGEQLFGEERIAAHLRRDPGVDVHVLCKSLVEAADDFATSPISDDIAILAARRV